MSKFTPGPWERRHLTIMGPSPVSDAYQRIASVHNDWNSLNAEANAKLIAAAPSMLLALTWLVGLKDERPADYEEQKPLAWGAARAAIRMATGGIDD